MSQLILRALKKNPKEIWKIKKYDKLKEDKCKSAANFVT